MPEILTITTMGKHTLRDTLFDRVLGALKNLRLDASDDERAAHAVSAVLCCGEHRTFSDHGTWAGKSEHQ